MVRFMAGLAAWAAGTGVAVCIAWFGANIVVRNAEVDPGMPVINVAAAPSPGRPLSAVVASVPASPGRPVSSGGAVSSDGAVSSATPVASAPVTPFARSASAVPSASGGGGASVAVSPSSSASASPSGSVRGYALVGGHVTLDVTQDSAQLVTAVPDAGYSVQTWSGPDWLRVDFSSGANVSSLIASWNGHAPTITVEN